MSECTSLEEIRSLLADADVAPVVAVQPVDGLTPAAAMVALGTEASCFLLSRLRERRHDCKVIPGV